MRLNHQLHRPEGSRETGKHILKRGNNPSSRRIVRADREGREVRTRGDRLCQDSNGGVCVVVTSQAVRAGPWGGAGPWDTGAGASRRGARLRGAAPAFSQAAFSSPIQLAEPAVGCPRPALATTWRSRPA